LTFRLLELNQIL